MSDISFLRWSLWVACVSIANVSESPIHRLLKMNSCALESPSDSQPVAVTQLRPLCSKGHERLK